ncbi:MAG: DUF2336 domain-containing protein [Acetobacteraceae bacterium]|nr:DUF2336 domain-containing protein [Acetobacteraceae bacterium]
MRLSASAATLPATLNRLASDKSSVVRAALALNPAAPHEANQALACDDDERVRLLVARKLAGLVPSLSNAEQAGLQRQVFETLSGLVMDEAVRIRAVIADALKAIPNAPRELILRLAQDAAVQVSEPVIRFSPLLTTADLLALLAKAPVPATLIAVAGRAGIDEAVSDAVASSADSAAIRALLANKSAQIREATLDTLIAQASEHTDWHEPLVRRPALTPAATRALSQIVTTHLLHELLSRADIDPSLARELRNRLADHLSEPKPHLPRPGSEFSRKTADATGTPPGHANEEAVLAAARKGEAGTAAALLAVAAGVPVSVVERAASLRSAKSVVSLVWKAGFSMRTGVALQTLLAHIAPGAVLPAGPGDGFPLAVEEMRWQLEFLGQTGRSFMDV